MTADVFEQLYRSVARAPWDLDGPTPGVVALEEAGLFHGHVLDAGCGTGENALYLAARGHRVVGVDAAPTAIARAWDRARERGLDVTFEVADACELPGYSGRFDTVLDSGLLHSLTAAEEARYVAALHRATRPGAVVHLLCFSDRSAAPLDLIPGAFNTHGVSEDELRHAFAVGWSIELLQPVPVELEIPGGQQLHLDTWLARIRRLQPVEA
jgi:SAM-dependent methyltransferase